MVNKEDSLKEISKDRDYEEQLTETLSLYFIGKIKYIPELTIKEKNKIETNLKIILDDSVKHKNKFNEIIDFIFNNEFDNY